MEKLLKFLNSGAGLIILGFLVTTGGGAFLNSAIQRQARENERSFEMFETRFEEAKELQKDLLERTSDRSVALALIYLNAKKKGGLDEKKEVVAGLWKEYSDEAKTRWNEDLIMLHSKMRAIFPVELADLLLAEDEWETEDVPLARLLGELEGLARSVPADSEPVFTKKRKSIHGAFVVTHRTLYYLIHRCSDQGEKEEYCRAELLDLAEEQISRQELLVQCLSYGIADALLVDPNGPEKETATGPPSRCKPFLGDTYSSNFHL